MELPSQSAVHLADTPLSDDYRYGGFLDDFHRAVELWNRGDYGACVPLFEKLAAAGDATASTTWACAIATAWASLAAMR